MGHHERAELEGLAAPQPEAPAAAPDIPSILSPQGLLALQRTAGNQRVTRMLATREFEMEGARHTLGVQRGPGGVELIMASTPEDVRKKLARFEATVANYIARLEDPGLDARVKAATFLTELRRLKGQVETAVGRLAEFDPKRYSKDEEGFTKVGKARRGAASVAVAEQSKVDADADMLDRAITEIDTIAGKLSRFAGRQGIEGLDPADVETWAHEQFMEGSVYGKQAEVADVIGPHVAAIAEQLPGAKVKFRGSLARGLKSFRKPGPGGAVQRFDPSNFDADAFIEVPDDLWATMNAWEPAGLGSKVKLAPLIVLAERRNAPLLAALKAVQRLEGEIRKGLGDVRGYSKQGGSAEFYFVVQSETAGAEQLEEGNPYPPGALAQAGLPAIERGLGRPRYRGELKGPAVYTGEIHVEVHEDSSRTQDVTHGARL